MAHASIRQLRRIAVYSTFLAAVVAAAMPARAGDAPPLALAPLIGLDWKTTYDSAPKALRLRENRFGGYLFDPGDAISGARKSILWFNGPGGELGEILIEGRAPPGDRAGRAFAAITHRMTAACGAGAAAGVYLLWNNERCFARLTIGAGSKWTLQLARPRSEY